MLDHLFNRTAQAFKGRDFLTLIPESRVDFAVDEVSERVTLSIPRYRDPVFGLLIQPRLGPDKRFVKMTLDKRGSWLWLKMDGVATVGDLVRGFEECFPGDTEQAPERISGYLYHMFDNKLLQFRNL